ncbi:MAG: hypothetical protein GY756_00575 [bacterium]|nr:hypothetical protein [bacterium]
MHLSVAHETSHHQAFILLVTVEEPQGNIYGGPVAAPVFKAIAEKTLLYLDIPSDCKI